MIGRDPLRSHEMSRCAAISDGLVPGDVVMGDRWFSSYAHPAILAAIGAGHYGSLEAARAMVAPIQTFDPQMESTARDQRLGQWTKALRC